MNCHIKQINTSATIQETSLLIESELRHKRKQREYPKTIDSERFRINTSARRSRAVCPPYRLRFPALPCRLKPPKLPSKLCKLVQNYLLHQITNFLVQKTREIKMKNQETMSRLYNAGRGYASGGAADRCPAVHPPAMRLALCTPPRVPAALVPAARRLPRKMADCNELRLWLKFERTGKFSLTEVWSDWEPR